MKRLFFILFGLVFVLSIFCLDGVMTNYCNASSVNYGTIQAKSLEINLLTEGAYEIDDDLIVDGSVTIHCDVLCGEGLLCSPQISIEAREFTFTGTIDCSKRCLIITGTPISQDMFKRTGEGKFTFIVDETLL